MLQVEKTPAPTLLLCCLTIMSVLCPSTTRSEVMKYVNGAITATLR